MSMMINPFFRGFCSKNFPYIEKEFDALTDYELMCKILEEIEKQINEIDQKYADIMSIRDDFNNFKVEIQAEMVAFKNEVDAEISQELENQYARIILLMSEYQTVVNNMLEDLRDDLEQEIQSIELGNVIAYNPTNGEYENVSKVIADVYDTFRSNGITATEFDALDLTATAFDAYEITAHEFDLEAKTILV